MDDETGKTRLRINGMTCVNCERRIRRALLGSPGVRSAEVSFAGGFAEIKYDPADVSLPDLRRVIENEGYSVSSENFAQAGNRRRAIGLCLLIVALYMLLSQSGIMNLFAPGLLAEAGMGYGALFVVGLLTSVHCVAMCGGINLSQTVGETGLAPAALYNLGRVLSYTAVGFIVGALGSVVSFTQTAQGVLKLIAGAFMVIMGANMLGIFPPLRRLAIRFPHIRFRSKNPLFVGLLNGLMPCGPLQAMQIYALSTASPVKGALSMLIFSLGTVPLMFGLGAISSALGKKFSRKVMAVGAVLVVVLGLSMLSQGWSFSGLPSLPSVGETAANRGEEAATLENGVQVVTSTLQPGRYPTVTVRAGIPVKWVIDAPEGSINGCNNAIYIPEYGIEYSFKAGENIVEFTPDKAGRFGYSCWMGMIRGAITVVDGE